MRQGQERIQPRAEKHDDETTDEFTTPHVETDVNMSAINQLLDEIDSVLEENAEQFVENYVQRGGQ